MSLKYSIVVDEDGNKNLTVFYEKVYQADQTHPHWREILDGILNGDENVIELFDVAEAVARKFERISERVTVSNGHVFFDGDEVNNSLTKQILRFMESGEENWRPLVLFFENVAQNPSKHSRTQLYDWLTAHDFTITDSGEVVGYKGVHKRDGKLLSGSRGHAISNGVEYNGQIPNEVGFVVEMPREEVAWDPSNACSSGLHVGTFDYAKGFANGAMLKVYVNPRDVVSVPTDAAGEKVRVCRYRVIEVIDAPETSALVYDDDFEDDDYDERRDDGCCRCGDPDCDQYDGGDDDFNFGPRW